MKTYLLNFNYIKKIGQKTTPHPVFAKWGLVMEIITHVSFYSILKQASFLPLACIYEEYYKSLKFLLPTLWEPFQNKRESPHPSFLNLKDIRA